MMKARNPKPEFFRLRKTLSKADVSSALSGGLPSPPCIKLPCPLPKLKFA